MAERLTAALVMLHRLEECIQGASEAGLVLGDAFASNIGIFASRMEEEAAQFETLVEEVRRANVGEDKQDEGGGDASEVSVLVAQGNDDDDKHGNDDDKHGNDGDKHGNDGDDDENDNDDENAGGDGASVEKQSKRQKLKRSRSSKALLVEMPRREGGKKKVGKAVAAEAKKKRDTAPGAAVGTKGKLSLFTVARTSKGAIVLYDPNKVEKRGRNAELVTVPLMKKNNVRIKRTELQLCQWSELSLNQQNALTARMCSEVRLVAERNFGTITSGEGAGLILAIFRGGGAAVSAASAALFQKGTVLQALAKNAAIRASYREYVRLGVGGAVYESALEKVVETYGMDFSVETLRRYRVVGELFHQCPALMLCDFVTTLFEHKELFGHMLARPELKQQINAILLDAQAIENGNGGPFVQLVEGQERHNDDEVAEAEDAEDAEQMEDRGNKVAGKAAEAKQVRDDEGDDGSSVELDGSPPLKKHAADGSGHDNVHVCLQTMCSQCDGLFCPSCANYDAVVVRMCQERPTYPVDQANDQPSELPLTIMCLDCLEEVSIPDCTDDDLEAKYLSFTKFFQAVSDLCDLFQRQDSEFKWKPVPADGSCLVVATALVQGVGVLEFCKALSVYVIEWSKSRDNAVFFVPDEGEDMAVDKLKEFQTMWTSIGRCRTEKSVLKPIRAAWNSSGGDMMLKLIGDYLFERCGEKQLRVYEQRAVAGLACDGVGVDGGAHQLVSASYPDRPCQGSVNLLRWNAIVPHFDVLEPKV